MVTACKERSTRAHQATAGSRTLACSYRKLRNTGSRITAGTEQATGLRAFLGERQHHQGQTQTGLWGPETPRLASHGGHGGRPAPRHEMDLVSGPVTVMHRCAAAVAVDPPLQVRLQLKPRAGV